MRVLLAFAAIWLVAVALPPAASAATWKGKTHQGRGVVVRTASDGTVSRVRIGWRARCGNGSYVSRTLFRAPFDASTTTTFTHTGSYRGHPTGYRSKIWVRVAGSLDAGKWSGTFKVKVRVTTKQGEGVDVCRLRRLRWSAAPA